MASLGASRTLGVYLSGFAHVEQSIDVILTTPIGSRVMRRDFGSELFDLIDRPLTDRIILAVYAAAVTAIARWEPRFAVSACRLEQVDPDGKLSLYLMGIYYPRGHLGDFSKTEDAKTRVLFERR